jgi:hypothetical protein
VVELRKNFDKNKSDAGFIWKLKWNPEKKTFII